jgi:hypothetical protein
MAHKSSALLLAVVWLINGCATSAHDISRSASSADSQLEGAGDLIYDSILNNVELRHVCTGYMFPKDLDQPVSVEQMPDLNIFSGEEVKGPSQLSFVAVFCVNQSGTVDNVFLLECEPTPYYDNIVRVFMKWKFRPATKHNKTVCYIYAVRMIINIE